MEVAKDYIHAPRQGHLRLIKQIIQSGGLVTALQRRAFKIEVALHHISPADNLSSFIQGHYPRAGSKWLMTCL
jgi:hypothetical protein